MPEKKNVVNTVLKELKPNVLYMNNNNIDYNSMAKHMKFNVNYLDTLAQKVKNGDLKEKANTLIQLYVDRKMSQTTSADKRITSFITYDKEKPKQKDEIDTTYNTSVSKYQD